MSSHSSTRYSALPSKELDASSTPSSPKPSSTGSQRLASKKVIALALMSLILLASFRQFRSYSGVAVSTSRGLKSLSSGGKTPSFKLPSGDRIPGVALGTWKAAPGQVGDAVTAALKAVRMLYTIRLCLS